MNKESASGTVGFEPQAQSVEARSQCLGPILGSTRDPVLHLKQKTITVVKNQ